MHDSINTMLDESIKLGLYVWFAYIHKITDDRMMPSEEYLTLGEVTAKTKEF